MGIVPIYSSTFEEQIELRLEKAKENDFKLLAGTSPELDVLSTLLCRDSAASNNIFDFSRKLLLHRDWNQARDLDSLASRVVRGLIGNRDNLISHSMEEAFKLIFPEEETTWAALAEKEFQFLGQNGVRLSDEALKYRISNILPFNVGDSHSIISGAGGDDVYPEESMIVAYVSGQVFSPVKSSLHLETLVGYLLPESGCDKAKGSLEHYLCFKLFKMNDKASKAIQHYMDCTEDKVKGLTLTPDDANFIIDNVGQVTYADKVLEKVLRYGPLSLARESLASLDIEKISSGGRASSIFMEASFLSLLKDPRQVSRNRETLESLVENGMLADHIKFLNLYPSEAIKAVELYSKEFGQFKTDVHQTFVSINEMISLKSPKLSGDERIALLVELIGNANYDGHGLQPSWLFERFGSSDAPLNNVLDVTKRKDCLEKIEQINKALKDRPSSFWTEVIAEMYASMLSAAYRLEANEETLAEWYTQKKLSTADMEQIITGRRAFKETTRLKSSVGAIHSTSPSVLEAFYKSMPPTMISRLNTHMTSYYNNNGVALMTTELVDAGIINQLPEPSKYLETGIMGAKSTLEVMSILGKFTSSQNIGLLLSFLEYQSADSNVWFILADALPHIKVLEHIYSRVRRIASAITRSHMPLLYAFIKSLEVPVELKSNYFAALENLIKWIPAEWKLGTESLSKPIDLFLQALSQILLSTKLCINRGDLFDSCKLFGSRFAKILSFDELWQAAILGNNKELKAYVEFLSSAISESRPDDIELYAPFIRKAIERGYLISFLKALNQKKITWDVLFGNAVKNVADLASFSFLAEGVLGKHAKLTWRQWMDLVPLMKVYRKYSEIKYVPTMDSDTVDAIKRAGDADFAITYDDLVKLLTSKLPTTPATKDQESKLSGLFKDGAKTVMRLEAWERVFATFSKASEASKELSATVLFDVVEDIMQNNNRIEFHPEILFSDKEWEYHLRVIPLGFPWKNALENLCETCSSIIKSSAEDQGIIGPQSRIAVYTRIMDRVTQSTVPKCRNNLFTSVQMQISPLLDYEVGEKSPLEVMRSQVFGSSPINNPDIISAAIFSKHVDLDKSKRLSLLNNAFAVIDPYSHPSFDSPAVDFTKKELLKDMSKEETRMITEKLTQHKDSMIAFQVRSALTSHSHYKLASLLNELIPDRNYELLLSFLTESPYSGSKNDKNALTKLLQMMELSLTGKSGDLKMEDGVDVKSVAKIFSFQTISSLKSCNYLDMANYEKIPVDGIQSIGDDCFKDLGQDVSETILNTPRFLQSLKAEQITPQVLTYVMPSSLYFLKAEVLAAISLDACRAFTETQILGLHSSENLHRLSPRCIQSMGPKWVYALIRTTLNNIHPEIEGIMRILDIDNFKGISEDLMALYVQGRQNGLPLLWKLLGESVRDDLHPCRAIDVDLGYQFYQGASKRCLLSADLMDPTKTFFEKTKVSRLNFVSREVWASMAGEALHLLEKGNRLHLLDGAMVTFLETAAAEAKQHIYEL